MVWGVDLLIYYAFDKVSCPYDLNLDDIFLSRYDLHIAQGFCCKHNTTYCMNVKYTTCVNVNTIGILASHNVYVYINCFNIVLDFHHMSVHKGK